MARKDGIAMRNPTDSPAFTPGDSSIAKERGNIDTAEVVGEGTRHGDTFVRREPGTLVAQSFSAIPLTFRADRTWHSLSLSPNLFRQIFNLRLGAIQHPSKEIPVPSYPPLICRVQIAAIAFT
jgi:hypothetical protein